MSKALEEGEGRSGAPPASISGSLVAEAVEDVSAIKGQLDPVYEAKAKVLNRAVSAVHLVIDSIWDPFTHHDHLHHHCRSRISGWGGTNGNCSS